MGPHPLKGGCRGWDGLARCYIRDRLKIVAPHWPRSASVCDAVASSDRVVPRFALGLACSLRLLHLTQLICWGKCWGKKPRSMRNRFIINDLVSADGGVGLRLLVISAAPAIVTLTSIPGSLAIALVLVVVMEFGQERRRSLHHWTKALPPRAAWHQ
jgi:hypothetical protein